MINEITVRPQPANNKAKTFMITAFVLAGVALVAYLISPLYKGIIGIFVVAFITAATFLYTKYVAGEYNYDRIRHTALYRKADDR